MVAILASSGRATSSIGPLPASGVSTASSAPCPIASNTRLALMRPEIRVLLISGYSEESLSLKDGWQFLAKPFAPFDLIAKAEATLAMRTTTERWKVSSGRTL